MAESIGGPALTVPGFGAIASSGVGRAPIRFPPGFGRGWVAIAGPGSAVSTLSAAGFPFGCLLRGFLAVSAEIVEATNSERTSKGSVRFIGSFIDGEFRHSGSAHAGRETVLGKWTRN